MGITRINLKNFKSCKENFELNNLKPISVIVGSNNVGKSNIIEGLRLAKDLATGSLSTQYELLSFDKKREPITIEIDIELSDEERKSLFKELSNVRNFEGFDFKNDNFFKYIRYISEVYNDQNTQRESLLVTDSNKKYIDIVQNTRQSGSTAKSYADILNFIRSHGIERFSEITLATNRNDGSGAFGIFMPRTLQSPLSNIVDIVTQSLRKIIIYDAYRKVQPIYPSGVHTKLAESGLNLSGILHTLLSTNRGKFDEIMKIYNNIVGGIKNLHSPPVNDQFTVSIEEDGLASQTNFDKMSTGLHQALILIVAIEMAELGETICIEEPEIHLHASSQKRLFNYICQHSNKNQFFITTHSSIFTGISDMVSTHLVTKSKGVSHVTQIENENQLKFIKQQLGIRNSDMYGNDYVIFIEGDSEQYAFPIISNALDYSDIGTDVNSRIRIMNLEGNGIIPKLEQFLRYLDNSDVEVFLIADGDKRVKGSVEDFIRIGILKNDHAKVWEKEFEDTFESKRIIDAMKKLSIKNGFTFDMSVDYLNTERTSKKITEVLQKYLYEKEQPDLDKPKLAQQLSQDIAEELRSDTARIETEFEVEIKRIMNIIKSTDTRR